VPGATAGRHVVYDAPEAADGSSAVTATAQSGRCVVAITAGAGNGVTGHPLMFQVAAASAGCQVTSAGTTASAGGTGSPGSGTVSGSDGGSTGSGASAADAGTVGTTPPVAVDDAGAASGSEDGGTPTAESDGGVANVGDTGGGCANEAPAHLPGTNGALLSLVAFFGLRRNKRRRG
jgi:hypothetical protein